MKKLFSIFILIFLLANLCSCALYADSFDDLYNSDDSTVNENIIELALIEIHTWRAEENRSFSVVNHGNSYYTIDINGVWADTYVENTVPVKIVKSNVSECADRETKLFGYAKDAVISYIDETDFFENKEMLKEYISSLSIKSADFSIDYDIDYDTEYDAVIINREYEQLCTERMAYALICALMHKTQQSSGITESYYVIDISVATRIAFYTNACDENTCLGECKENDSLSYATSYVDLYLGCVGVPGLKACFYGYDEIFELIPKDELDVFHSCLYKLDSDDNIIIICNCINQWIIEAEERNPNIFDDLDYRSAW